MNFFLKQKKILAIVSFDFNLVKIKRDNSNGFFLFGIDTMLEGLKLVGAGLATIGLVGAGTGVGFVFGSLISAISRNPVMKPELFKMAILGFALTEAVGLLH